MKKLLLFLAALSLLFVYGCSSSNGGGSSKEASAVSENKTIEFGKKEDAKYFLQVDINPSVIIGYAENDEVVYLASNNADGYELLEKHDAAAILGEPVNAAVGSIMTAAHQDGYEAENFDVAINFAGEEKGSVEDIVQITRKAVETCNFDITAMVEQENKLVYSAEDGITEDYFAENNAPQLCEACNGEGIVVCEECGGKGERIIIVQREKEVRNDYVCEICGGKGWIDDGLHGGEIGNCDSCGGIAGKDSSADFKEKAYDKVMVDEEEMRRCDKCDGSGEIVCEECGGTGQLD